MKIELIQEDPGKAGVCVPRYRVLDDSGGEITNVTRVTITLGHHDIPRMVVDRYLDASEDVTAMLEGKGKRVTTCPKCKETQMTLGWNE